MASAWCLARVGGPGQMGGHCLVTCEGAVDGSVIL